MTDNHANPVASKMDESELDHTPRVLVVDDEEVNLDLMRRFLSVKGYEVVAARDGLDALARIAEHPPDVIILDLIMPNMNGYEVCERIKANPSTRHIPVIILTGAPKEEANVRALEAGADDFLQRPFDASLLDARLRNCICSKILQDRLIEYHRRLEGYNEQLEDGIRRRTAQLERTQHATVFALAKLAESRDPETGRHLERIRGYGRELALDLAQLDSYRAAINREFVDTLFYSSPLHDIGKVGIPDRILLKPGKLTKAEFEIMKTHTEIGGDTLRAAEEEGGGSPLIRMGCDITYYHHERWDGSGYPKGLAGEAIPLAARIISLADCYDALVSKRAYKEPFPHEKARQLILEGAGTQFDPHVVSAFRAREAAFVKIHQELRDTGHPTRIQQLMETLDALDRGPDASGG